MSSFNEDEEETYSNGGTISMGKPKILLFGLRRSGKSSIQKVVFHKMSPNETLFLESTNKIIKDDINNSRYSSSLFALSIVFDLEIFPSLSVSFNFKSGTSQAKSISSTQPLTRT